MEERNCVAHLNGSTRDNGGDVILANGAPAETFQATQVTWPETTRPARSVELFLLRRATNVLRQFEQRLATHIGERDRLRKELGL
jgi:hypothetical protein